MRSLVASLAMFCAFQGAALADHAKLKTLSRDLGVQASRLYYGARDVIGPRPSARQRYAFEHTIFLHRSAHRFESAVGAVRELDRDHVSDVRAAFRRLGHDTSNARETFEDLFYSLRDENDRDHATDYKRLNALLTSIEALVQQLAVEIP